MNPVMSTANLQLTVRQSSDQTIQIEASDPSAIAAHLGRFITEIGQKCFTILQVSFVNTSTPQMCEPIVKVNAQAKRLSEDTIRVRCSLVSPSSLEKYASEFFIQVQKPDTSECSRKAIGHNENPSNDSHLENLSLGSSSVARAVLCLTHRPTALSQPHSSSIKDMAWVVIDKAMLSLTVVRAVFLTIFKICFLNPVEYLVQGEVRIWSPLGILRETMGVTEQQNNPHQHTDDLSSQQLSQRRLITEATVDAFRRFAQADLYSFVVASENMTKLAFRTEVGKKIAAMPRNQVLDLSSVFLTTELAAFIENDKRKGAIPLHKYLRVLEEKGIGLQTLSSVASHYKECNTLYLKKLAEGEAVLSRKGFLEGTINKAFSLNDNNGLHKTHRCISPTALRILLNTTQQSLEYQCITLEITLLPSVQDFLRKHTYGCGEGKVFGMLKKQGIKHNSTNPLKANRIQTISPRVPQVGTWVSVT